MPADLKHWPSNEGNMRNRRSILGLTSLVFLPGVLYGCASQPNPYIVETKLLTRKETKEELTLSKRLQYSPRRDLFYALMPGVYVAEYEGAEGTYFRGPELCVVGYMQRNGEKPWGGYRQDGGLWLPKGQSSEPFRIYYYPGSGGPADVWSDLSQSVVDTTRSTLDGPARGASLLQGGIGVGISMVLLSAISEAQNSGRVNFFPFPEGGKTLEDYYVD